MANAVVDVIAPRVLILPQQTTIAGTPQTGTMVVSGAQIAIFTGTNWVTVSGSNVA